MNTKRRRRWAGLIYVLPAVLILGTFHLFPIVYAFILSLTDSNLIRPKTSFVGLKQYDALLSDPAFHTAIQNTIVYTFSVVVLSAVLGLALAVMLNQKLRGTGLYRTIVFLPVVTATSTAAVVWKWMYSPNPAGIVNRIVGLFGVAPQRWLLQPSLALPSIMAMSVWQSTGYAMVIFLAGLQGISTAVMEAAVVDGAGPWQRFRYVVLPLLTPTVFFVTVVSIIHSFQAVSQVIIMTEGGPLRRTLLVVYYLYQQAFGSFKMGYGAAMAMVVFTVIAVLTLIQWKIAERRVHYGG